MRTMRLCIDDEFEWNGSKFHVHDFEHPFVLIFKEDGERKIIKVKELSIITDQTFKIQRKELNLAQKSAQKSEANMRALIDTLPEKRRELALKRKSIISPILLYDEAMTGDLYAAHTFNEKYNEYLGKGETLETLGKKNLIERVAKKHDYSPRINSSARASIDLSSFARCSWY